MFKAYTTAEYVRRWWGCETTEWLVCEVDLRVGGRWRYVTRDEYQGQKVEIAFHGDYQEIDAPGRLVTTEVFEMYPDAAALDIITFEEAGGVTTMRMLVQHQEPAHRDAHMASGMESGMQLAMDRLEGIVGEM